VLNEYEQEAKDRWGETDAYKQSTSRTSKYTKDNFAAAKVDQEAATEKFVIAFGNSYAVTSAQAQDAVVAHRVAISKWFYECSVEMQKNLAVMYIEDHRFKAYYDGRVRGLAQYVHDAIMAQR
jgi:RecB family endonuclease NucS